MTMKKFRLPFQKRGRRRVMRADDPSQVFKTFVHVLARLQSNGTTVNRRRDGEGSHDRA